MYGCSNCGSPCGNKPMVLCDDCYKIDEEVIIKMANRRDQALDDLKAEIANHREDTALLEAMRETAAEQSRVHIEMHNQIIALQAEVARLRNDLLAYGQHLDSCKMLCIAKTDGWKYAKLHGCSCGFDIAKEGRNGRV